MAESNETQVSLEQVKDIYEIEVELCNTLIKEYDIAGRQIYRLAESWTNFKSRNKYWFYALNSIMS